MHNHGSDPHHHTSANSKRLGICMVLLTLAALVEAGVGWLAGSLALLTDALHMSSDVLALGLAAFAAWYAKKPPTARHSYGMGRMEVMAALVNALFNIVLVIPMIVVAIKRFGEPEPVAGGMVSVAALTMIVITMAVFLILRQGEQTLNMRGAVIHVLGDVAGSVAAALSGIIIYFTGWVIVDPILTLLICALIIFSTWQLLRDTVVVLMEGVPPNVDLHEIYEELMQHEHIQAVHDLHVWTLSSGNTMLTAQVTVDSLEYWPDVLVTIQTHLATHYEITHCTIQPLTSDTLQHKNGCYSYDKKSKGRHDELSNHSS